MTEDSELLRAYVENHSEDAFRTLVERHVGMVHGTALRMVRNEAVAEEVTQAVFILLARKAPAMNRTLLPGWLYRTTRFVSLEALRAERRRLRHHEEFAEMETPADQNSAWSRVSPLLDEALSRLGESERDALVLRFLQGRSFADVGQALGTTEAAAKMRVARALERLRVALARLGFAVPGIMLMTTLTAHGVSFAPSALSATATAAALSTGPTQASISALATTTLKLMTWNKIKTIAAAAVIALLLGGGATIVWKSTPDEANSKAASPILTTFDPMQGEWAGDFELLVNDSPPIKSQAALSIRTRDGGRLCEIEMRVTGADEMTQTYSFSHSIMDGGQTVFTVSDPKTGRGDGEGAVTESLHNRQANEWRAGIRFPFANDRGVMKGLWHRRGDELHITSSDEFRRAEGTDYVVADLRLRRRTSASR